MSGKKPCPFGNGRCLCADCTDNAAYDDCKRGYCLNCLECIDAGKQVHDVYLCTGHTAREVREAERECPPEPSEARRETERAAEAVLLPPPVPAPRMDDGQSEKDIERAALMLEALRNYCETMAVVTGEQTAPWVDYAGALDVAITVLRK